MYGLKLLLLGRLFGEKNSKDKILFAWLNRRDADLLFEKIIYTLLTYKFFVNFDVILYLTKKKYQRKSVLAAYRASIHHIAFTLIYNPK